MVVLLSVVSCRVETTAASTTEEQATKMEAAGTTEEQAAEMEAASTT